MTDSEAEAMAEAIKYAEPALRVAGKAIDFQKFTWQFHSGQFSDEKTIQSAIENSAGDKVSLEGPPQNEHPPIPSDIKKTKPTA